MKARQAFTIVELLITITLFAMVAVLCVNALVNATASARKIQAQATLYSETQNLMDQLAREVERNTVDYEAYYLRNVQGETGWETEKYGYYAQSFYSPGSGGTEPGPYPDIWYKGQSYLDSDTGAHPFTGISSFDGSYDEDPNSMNAFCEGKAAECSPLSNGIVDELILINGSGDERSVFARQLFDATSTDYHLSTVKLRGSDTDNDGIVDHWVCSDKFPSCMDDVPDSTDFMPISPDILTIESFHVYITPMEDPYRATTEADTQVQPTVTLVLTATLSDSYSGRLLGDLPRLTIQRTVSTGVYSKIESY